jgi:hypothetical protein
MFCDFQDATFVSDIGGLLGVFLGFSILTVGEFMELGVDLVVWGLLWLRHREDWKKRRLDSPWKPQEKSQRPQEQSQCPQEKTQRPTKQPQEESERPQDQTECPHEKAQCPPTESQRPQEESQRPPKHPKRPLKTTDSKKKLISDAESYDEVFPDPKFDAAVLANFSTMAGLKSTAVGRQKGSTGTSSSSMSRVISSSDIVGSFGSFSGSNSTIASTHLSQQHSGKANLTPVEQSEGQACINLVW